MVKDSEKSERLLAFLLIENMKGGQREKIMKLKLSGFSNLEIADLMGITTQAVANYIYEAKKIKTTRRKRKK